MTFPLPTDITTFSGWGVYANTVTNGVFGIGLIFTIFIISLITISLNDNNFLRAIAASGYISAILSILMFVMGWIPLQIVVFFFIISTLAAIFLKS